MMRPYRLINFFEIQELKSRLTQVIQQWTTQYSLYPLSLQLTVPAREYSTADTVSISALEHSLARIDKKYFSFFNLLLFGEDSPCFNPACQELISSLFNELLQADHCTIDETIHPEPDWFYTGSTSLIITLNNEKDSLNIILNPDWVNKHLPEIQSKNTLLSTLEDALGEESLTLNLELLPFKLSVKQLVSLQAGDVLTTEHPLATPLRVTQKQELLIQAELGQSPPWKSIILKRSS